MFGMYLQMILGADLLWTGPIALVLAQLRCPCLEILDSHGSDTLLHPVELKLGTSHAMEISSLAHFYRFRTEMLDGRHHWD